MIHGSLIFIYDVLFSGPTYLLYASYINNTYLKLFIIIFGILTILLNLCLSTNLCNNNILLKKLYTKQSQPLTFMGGLHTKIQLVRLLDIFICYPLLVISLKYYTGPLWLKIMTIVKIIIEFIFNLTRFISLNK